MRACGSCTLCCKLVPVEQLAKPAGTRCQHQRSGKGCAIYQHRPISCREWNCLWLAGDEGGAPLDLSRPDRSHYVLDSVPDLIRARNNETGEVTEILTMQVWVDPKFPDAHRDPALRAMLERQRLVALVRYSSTEAFALFPPSRNSTGKWVEQASETNENMNGAQRQARFDFWSRTARASQMMSSTK